MGSQSQPGTTTDVPNYAGEMLFVGAKFGKSPLLSIAGLTTGWKRATGSYFPMSNLIAGDAPAQDGATEDALMAATTITTYTAAQKTNYLQNFYKEWAISYAGEALQGTLSGVAVAGMGVAEVNTLAVQRQAHLMQLAADYEYSALYGTGAAWTNASTTGAMAGILTTIQAGSETAAGGAGLSTTLIDTEIARMKAAGSEFGDMYVVGNSYQVQQMNLLYGNMPMSQTVGGINLQTIVIPVLGPCKVLCHAQLATDDLAFIDMNHFDPVFAVKDGRPEVLVEPKGKIGAATGEQLFMCASVDFGDVLFHGEITGLATS